MHCIKALYPQISRMNMFLVHLSVADLLTALLTLVPEIAWTLTSPLFHGGDLLCRSIKFLQMLGPYLSSFLLCVTSVDRYRAICRPFKSKHTNVSFIQIYISRVDCDISFPGTCWGRLGRGLSLLLAPSPHFPVNSTESLLQRYGIHI